MQTVDEYLKNVTPAQLAEFKRIKKIVTALAPDAGEKVSYGVPTFTYKGTYLMYFGAFKDHMSLYPAPEPMMEAIPELKKFRVSKGTLRFTHDNPIPDSLVKQIVQFRLAEISKR